jgi:hypothetical protein
VLSLLLSLTPAVTGGRRHVQPATQTTFIRNLGTHLMELSDFADLLAARGQRLLPGSHAVPVDVLVRQPDGAIARFTARGTTIRLALFDPDALASIVLGTDCGCGKHHEPTGPARTALRAGATPVLERVIDGRVAFGWSTHEAGLLRLAEAAPYYFELLDMTTVDQPTFATLP